MQSSGPPAAGPLCAATDFTLLSDQHLLGTYRQTRAADAFAQLVQRHRGMVYRSCLRLLGNAHDAEDATQAVFVVLAQRPNLVKRNLAGWLHDVARGIAIDLLRSKTSRARREVEAARMKSQEPAAVNEGHLREELDAALAGLPPAMREAVVLRYLEGRSQEEAARLAACPQGTLAWRCAEGVNRLRARLVHSGAVLTPASLIAFLSSEGAAAVPPLSGSVAKLLLAETAVESTQVALLAQNAGKALAWAKMKAMAAVVVATTAAVGAAGVAVHHFTGPLFADDFQSSQVQSAWAFRTGVWSQNNGVLQQTGSDPSGARKAVLVGRSCPDDMQITARVRVDSWTPGDYARAGIGLATDPATGFGYNLVFHEKAGAKTKVQFLDDWAVWGNAYEFPWETGVWYWFKLKRHNGVLSGKVWRDGTAEPAGWPYVQEGWTNRPGGAPALNGGAGHPLMGTATASFDDVRVDSD